MSRGGILVFAVAVMLLPGCASIVEGTDQTITVESSPAGANCRFYREGMVVAQVITPGGILVEKTKHDMTVECVKEGYETARANLDSGIEGATWGNIILGGGIGWAIDSASGADNEYPEYVNISLVPKKEFMDSAELADPQVPWIWHSVHDNVLAYSEYGASGNYLTMPTYVDLQLIRQQGEWGMFEYDARNNQRSQGWILMANVQTTPSGAVAASGEVAGMDALVPGSPTGMQTTALGIERFDGTWTGAGKTDASSSRMKCGGGPKIEIAIRDGVLRGKLVHTVASYSGTGGVYSFAGNVNEDGQIIVVEREVRIEGRVSDKAIDGKWQINTEVCKGEFQLTKEF